MLKVYEATNVGKVRDINEDSLACLPREVFCVADGMGGHAAGEVASRTLVNNAHGFLFVRDEIDEQDLAAAIACANEKILAMAEENQKYRGMGTTATVLHLTADRGFWAHVGDSRLYLWRNNSLGQITRDHSYVEELLASGSITREEAQHHPRRNLLTRAVGVMKEVEIDRGNFPLERGDVFLLCTDGLTNMVDDGEISAILADANAPDPAAKLVERALEGGGLDNVSAIVVKCDGA